MVLDFQVLNGGSNQLGSFGGIERERKIVEKDHASNELIESFLSDFDIRNSTEKEFDQCFESFKLESLTGDANSITGNGIIFSILIFIFWLFYIVINGIFLMGNHIMYGIRNFVAYYDDIARSAWYSLALNIRIKQYLDNFRKFNAICWNLFSNNHSANYSDITFSSKFNNPGLQHKMDSGN